CVGPVEEELDCRVCGELLDSWTHGAGPRWEEWWDGPEVFATSAQRFATCGENSQPGASPQQRGGQIGAALNHVLAAVEAEQQLALLQCPCQRVANRLAGPFVDVQCGSHDARHQLRVVAPAQVREPDAV